MTTSLVAEWDNFYVIIGSSAAGLTGLTFVVITLAADAKRVSFTGLRAYVTPIIVHFGAALALAAYLSMPHQGILSLSLGLGAAGISGLAYVAIIASDIGRVGNEYVPVREDWIWNAILPGSAYGLLIAMSLVIWFRPEASLFGVAAAATSLMFIGIHNAWDVAVWNAIRNRGDS
jgi:hypothetical protein